MLHDYRSYFSRSVFGGNRFDYFFCYIGGGVTVSGKGSILAVNEGSRESRLKVGHWAVIRPNKGPLGRRKMIWWL